MPIPTEQNPMKLLPWEQHLYDAGIHRGRSQRGEQLAQTISTLVGVLSALHKELSSKFTEDPALSQMGSAIQNLNEILKGENDSSNQLMELADRLLVAANNDRAHHDLQRSRFTASAIDAIMKVMEWR